MLSAKILLLGLNLFQKGSAKPTELSLNLYNVHTKEELVLKENSDDYLSTNQAKINYFFRDWRNQQTHTIAPELIKELFKIITNLNYSGKVHLISGYRSKETNDKLCKKSKKVSRNSYHLKGMAADIILPGIPLKKLFFAAKSCKMGGVGYYPASFVHIDVRTVCEKKPIRSWGNCH